MRIPPSENLILLGDQGLSARHVRFCRAKVEDFRKQVGDIATLSYKLIFRDGWAILKVSKHRHKIVIYTEAGSCTYEMFTSEHIEPNYLFTPPFDGDPDAISVCGKGSFHTIGSATKTAALVDLCDGCSDLPTDPGDLDPLIEYQKMDCGSAVGLADMKTPDMWNMVKAQPYLWYDQFLGEKFVIGGHDNAPYFKPNRLLSRFNVRYDPLPGGGTGWFLYSVGHRVPSAFNWDQFTPYSEGGITPGAGEYLYGGALVRTPTTELICCVNDTADWYFWPTGDYTVTPPVRVETVAVGLGPTLYTGLETIQFNSTGTKCVAVLTEYQDGVDWQGGGFSYKAVQDYHKGLAFGSGNVDSSYLGTKTRIQEELPWLIEYDINAFDDVQGDWQVTVTPGYTNRYLATDEWIIAADYLGKGFSYPKDSLVIATCEVYYDNAHGLVVGATPYWPDTGSVHYYALLHIKVWNGTGFDTVRTMMMSENIFTYASTTTPFQDPFGNDQAGWKIDMIEGDDGTGGYYLALRSDTLNALNLKTLSWVRYRYYQTQPGATSDTRVGSSCIEVWHKNNLLERKQQLNSPHGPTTFTSGEGVWPKANHTKLSSSEIELLSPIGFSIFNPLFRGQFAWHPKGHVAVCTPLTPVPSAQDEQDVPGDYFMVDFVLAHGSKTTHEALYNKAFNDTRTKVFYNDEPLNENYRGVFMTAGLFRDK